MKKNNLNYFLCTIIVFITNLTFSQVDAVNDNFTVPSFASGTIGNVLTNDILDGSTISNPADVIITNNSPTMFGFTIDSNGNLIMTGAPSGLNTITYTICKASDPTQCDVATITVYVEPTVNANDDFITINSNSTSTTVLINDTIDGIPISFGQAIASNPSSFPFDISINSNGQLFVGPLTPAGTYLLQYQVCSTVAFISCDIATIHLTVLPRLTVSMVGTYVDYNADGFVNVGDVVTYQFTVTNPTTDSFSNIVLSDATLTIAGTPISTLAGGATDTTTFSATHVLTLADIMAGVVTNNATVAALDFSSNTFTANTTTTTSLGISDAIKMNVFIDANSNNIQDAGEINFSDGTFHYELNNSGIIQNITNPSGMFFIYETNAVNSYDLSYTIDPAFTSVYFPLTVNYSNIQVLAGSGVTTYNFPITEIPFNDLTVVLTSFRGPVPGFTHINVIRYENKGTSTIASGTVTFDHASIVTIDPVAGATPTATGFTYPFTNLLRNEVRYIYVSVNTPTIPTVSLGDLVTNTASITIPSGDINPTDNLTFLTQDIRGSYDPNDKTESHGGSILASSFLPNDYLTYSIRFENTGTGNAINIRVDDVLSSSHDVSSLVMLGTSAPYTLSTIGNNLSWQFSGINLPPSVSSSSPVGKGFITFKVKLSGAAVAGLSVLNHADIYFDFNPAIVTNICTTQFTSVPPASGTSLNISTGVTTTGNFLSDLSLDPNWQIASSPNPPGTPAIVQSPWPGNWEPTPVAVTNAKWINSTGQFGSPNGTYTFERSITVPSGTTSLNYNFSVAWDDVLVSLELVRPDLTTIPLTVVQSLPLNLNILSLPITNTISNPATGVWKIRAVVNFADSIAGFLLSGSANLNCQTLYADADSDGYDNGSVLDCSGNVPTGYSLTTLGTDCDDTDPLVNSTPPIPANLQTGLLSQYTFNSGSTNDFSGNAHHLTNTNAAIAATDRNGNANCAFEFDNLPNSNNQFLSTANTTFLNGLSAYSISCWYKAKDPSRGIVDYEVLVGRDTSPFACPNRVGQWSLALYDCRAAVFARLSSVFENFASPCNETEVWHHLTATYNQVGETMKLYKDGVLQNTSTGIANCGSGSTVTTADIGDLFIGKGFTGILDDIYIHNREITASEVTQLYTLGSSCCAATTPCTAIITPTFTAVTPICSGAVLAALPTTSTNSITGTWSPVVDNTTTTIYTFTPAAGQCATTATMTITVNPSTTNTTTVSACDSYTWVANGQTYTTSGTYTYATTNGSGCLDTEILALTINNSTFSTTTASACDSYTWVANSQTYTTSGTYTNVTTNASGCSDTATLILTISYSTSSTINVSTCDSYTWAANGTTYTTSGTYTHLSSNVATPCIATATLVLIVTNSSLTTTNETACGTYTWSVNGQTYTTSGTYTVTNGCASDILNLTITPLVTWYLDADTDGFGTTLTSVTACTQPTGYVATSTDCNDANAAINPAAIDICLDGIDNDCNGIIDNVGQPGGCVPITTNVVNATCGSTVTNLAVTIAANWISGATQYRFRVKNLITGVITIVDRPINSFALINMLGATLNTPYEIDVAVMIGGVWQPFYGTPCYVTTPNPVSTIGAQCNTSLTSMTQFVYCTFVTSAIGYQFKVTNTVTGAVVIYDNVNNKFNFSLIAGSTFNTLYTVEVALQNTDGTYLPYNTACNITTPPYPTTQLIATQCAGFTPTNGNQFIYCTAVSGATMYQFRLFDGTTYTTPFPNSMNRFKLNNFAGLLPSTSYFVEVAVKMPNETNFGPYGSMCKIITPAVFRVDVTYNATLFKAIAYPNPFVSSFLLDVKTSSESKVQVKVYDMLGRILEDKSLNNNDLSTLEIGADYPSGVYTIIVTQDESYDSLRVIKK